MASLCRSPASGFGAQPEHASHIHQVGSALESTRESLKSSLDLERRLSPIKAPFEVEPTLHGHPILPLPPPHAVSSTKVRTPTLLLCPPGRSYQSSSNQFFWFPPSPPLLAFPRSIWSEIARSRSSGTMSAILQDVRDTPRPAGALKSKTGRKPARGCGSEDEELDGMGCSQVQGRSLQAQLPQRPWRIESKDTQPKNGHMTLGIASGTEGTAEKERR